MFKKLIVLFLGFTLIACKSQRIVFEPVILEESLIDEGPAYNASETQIFDLIHTELHLSFDWEKSAVIGKAIIKLQPYFYPVNELVLDAKSFDIKAIYLTENPDSPLNFQYDYREIKIQLPKYYKKAEKFSVVIEYTAIPGSEKAEKEAAITDDKGLFFINPTAKKNGYMPQIWTQGEPESNSRWFPTIDNPVQKMSQDIFLEIDNKYQSLSNGSLVSSTASQNGKRIDHWKQILEDSPYLTMIAVGEFSKISDSWGDMDVDYYLEKEQAHRAQEIFGNTPEMLEFYSNILGVQYPWEKYAQIVVREYVSGAMENTSAVVFGDFMYDTKKDLGGKNHEDVIAHELFHHWFGDLVTCESWANLPLNESFATYGEYLWKEHKYGRTAADYHLHVDYTNYLRESIFKKEDLIRFDYDKILHMFDNHSYAKGGRILHMLRHYLGDEAFFAGLQHYLEKHAFQTVEIHDLRIAMEKISGQDLNWFFNQWFLASGHPDLNIKYNYLNGIQHVEINQIQDLENYPLYKIPLSIDFYVNGKMRREYLTINKESEVFTFPLETKPDLVDLDPERVVLKTSKDNKTKKELLYQFKNSNYFEARYEAFSRLLDYPGPDREEMIKAALNDSFWIFRSETIQRLENLNSSLQKKFRSKIKEMENSDEHIGVRQAAKLFLNGA